MTLTEYHDPTSLFIITNHFSCLHQSLTHTAFLKTPSIKYRFGVFSCLYLFSPGELQEKVKLKRPTEVFYRLFTILSVWYKNIYLEAVPSLGFCACMYILIRLLLLNTVMFPSKYSLGIIQYQQKGLGILWQEFLFFL